MTWSADGAAWRGYRRDAFPARSWAVEGEVLHALAGGEPVSLVTVQRFADFDLSLEWRLPAGGNSGILYRVNEEDEEPWQSGPELQLLGGGHPDAAVPETSCGALYGLYAPQSLPPCATRLFNVARVARSKFRDAPRFARAAEGHIALQHHGTDAWFRNVRIERG